MKLQIMPGAVEAWRHGCVPMTGPIDVTLPHWPAVLRGVWIESENPETHRVAYFIRDMCPDHAQWMLDEIDMLLRAGEIEVVRIDGPGDEPGSRSGV